MDNTKELTLSKFAEFVSQDPVITKEHPAGYKYIPISQIENDLDECSSTWSTYDFKYTVVSGICFASIQLELSLRVTSGPSLAGIIRRTGAIQFNLSDANGSSEDNNLSIAKSLCVKNAAKTLGKRFGRELNRDDDEHIIHGSGETKKIIEDIEAASSKDDLNHIKNGLDKISLKNERILKKINEKYKSLNG